MNNLSNNAKAAFPNRGLLEKALDSLLSNADLDFSIKVVERQIYSERQRYTAYSTL